MSDFRSALQRPSYPQSISSTVMPSSSSSSSSTTVYYSLLRCQALSDFNLHEVKTIRERTQRLLFLFSPLIAAYAHSSVAASSKASLLLLFVLFLPLLLPLCHRSPARPDVASPGSVLGLFLVFLVLSVGGESDGSINRRFSGPTTVSSVGLLSSLMKN